MGNSCSICASPKRGEAELRRAQGETIRDIAAALGLGEQSLKRHLRGGHRPRVVTRQRPTGADAVRTFEAMYGFPAMAYQVAVLTDSRPTILLKGRQIGATATAAALAVHTALAKPGSDTVVISPSQRQSSEITVRARNGFYAMNVHLKQDSAGLLRTDPGSRIISLPGNSRGIRGYAPALVVLDESAWIDDETYAAARPLVAASGGRLVIQSTPGVPAGFFHRLWTEEAGTDWLRMMVRSDEVPTISDEFLARERRELDPAVYAAEYEAQFGAVGRTTAPWFSEADFDEHVTDRYGGPLDVDLPHREVRK